MDPRFKKYLAIFAGGLAGGLLGLLLFSNFILSDIEDSLYQGAIIVGTNNQSNTTIPEPSVSVDFWQKIVSQSSVGLVAVQSFSNNRVIREGSGIIVSSDGLIATTSDVAFSGAFYQVMVNGDVLRGTLVARDAVNNLALIKVSSSNLTISSLDIFSTYRSGQDVLITGKITDLSNVVSFSQRGLVSYEINNDVVLDTDFNIIISGAKVVNSNGRVIGLSYLRDNNVYIVRASVIDNFIKNYLDTLSN